MDFEFEDDRIYCEEKGKTLAEITFPEVEPGIVDINHTYVDDSLRGQGVAGNLMEMAVSVISMNGKKIKASCPYAAKWLEKHKEHKDLMV